MNEEMPAPGQGDAHQRRNGVFVGENRGAGRSRGRRCTTLMEVGYNGAMLPAPPPTEQAYQHLRDRLAFRLAGPLRPATRRITARGSS